MGSAQHLHLSLLLTTCIAGLVTGIAEFGDLPKTVYVEDDVDPGTVVATFTINCTSSSMATPNVTLKNISPQTSVFNPPNILSGGTSHIYIYQVSLSPDPSLDARQVNLYVLTYSAQCKPEESATESQLSIRVNATDRLECSRGITDIEVPEDIAPSTFIYSTVLKRGRPGTFTYTIENATVPFTITAEGKVQPPATGFSREQADQTFSMVIVVKDSHGRSCRIPLTVKVEPVYHNQVNFTESLIAISVPENQGPLQNIITVHASGENVLYQICSPVTEYFTIDTVTGVIRNTYNLDLKDNPNLAQTQLLVKAYNMLHPSDTATITVNITVLQRNLQGPVCIPAIFMTQIAENKPIGWTLVTLSCSDVESGNNTLHYQMEDNQSPPYSFRMDSCELKVNTTLDADSVAMVNLNFQHQATILVTDSGSPPITTRIPVLVTVTRVNDYDPECPSQRTFSIPENAGFGALVGFANGTDRDYPFNNIEYSILGTEGGTFSFYIDSRTGQLFVLRPLDYEKQQKPYHFIIMLKDLDNDVRVYIRKTALCNITINVQDVNEQAPVCTPPFFHYSVCLTAATTTNIMQLKCEDEERSELTYNLADGNINGRFRLVGNSLFLNNFSNYPDGVLDPSMFELLVKVTDNRGAPRFSTTATIIVHVIQCTTKVPPTTTTTTTVSKKSIILHQTEQYWAPDPWFVVVLTLTGALLLSALGLLFWQLCWRKASGETSQPLLQNTGKDLERSNIIKEEPSKDKGKGSAEVLSLQHQFDGRAQDPVTGQYYLFDSNSGASRWV